MRRSGATQPDDELVATEGWTVLILDKVRILLDDSTQWLAWRPFVPFKRRSRVGREATVVLDHYSRRKKWLSTYETGIL